MNTAEKNLEVFGMKKFLKIYKFDERSRY